MLFGKKTKSGSKAEPSLRVSRQFIFVEVPLAVVAPEVVAWGEAVWWPASCPMQFKRLTEGEVAVGTRYRQKVRGTLMPAWLSEVTDLLPRSTVTRAYRKGPLHGYEVVRIGERANGTRIEYELHYHPKGLLNALLWKFLYEKKHEETIHRVLSALSEYVTRKYLKENYPE
jgi:hypothetical protein